MPMMPWEIKKPVIASVQGHALGGGCEIAMLCDLTIAADNAVFGEPEIRFADVGPAVVMPYFIGLKKARELLYFGDTIDAETALRLGMVNRVVLLVELGEVTLKYARRPALVAPEALYTAKDRRTRPLGVAHHLDNGRGNHRAYGAHVNAFLSSTTGKWASYAY
jgi:enoyl-CoA hydratase